MLRSLFAVLLFGLVAGCDKLASQLQLPLPDATRTSVSTGPMLLTPMPLKEVPGWRAGRHSAALPALLRSCERLRRQPPDQAMGPLSEMGRISDWVKVCDDAAVIRPGNDTEAQYFFESRFLAYALSQGGSRNGLITGYYEPELNGAWKSDGRFRFPLYSLPKDLISADLGSFDDQWQGDQIAGKLEGNRFVPYFSRADIEAGALAGRQLEILWTDNEIDAFFMHIQGTGRVRLPDGTHVRLGYAGRNGRRYTAVGRELVAAGVMRLKDVTMPAIRAWMEQNPVAGQALMKKNQSFVFFRVLKGDGPLGAQGVVLTPGRSLAVDRRYVPLGAPVWLATTVPGSKPARPLRRLLIAQDTGSAIKGVVRADLFWGHGREAGTMAGIMKQRGQMYMLLPRAAGEKKAGS